MVTETGKIDPMLKAQVAKISEFRKLEASINETKKEVAKQLEDEEEKMLAMLDASGLDSFKCEFGLVSVGHRSSVLTPKTPEDREAFKQYLISEGTWEQQWSVPSATVNSIWKDAFEAATARGDSDFKIPGLGGVTIIKNLSFRKAK